MSRVPVDRRKRFLVHDLAEIILGSAVLIIPTAITEEAWNLGRELAVWNIGLIASFSYLCIGGFVLHKTYDGSVTSHGREFTKRVASIYLVTLLIAAVVLFAVDRLPLFTSPLVAFKTTVLVSLPGSLLATVVDSSS